MSIRTFNVISAFLLLALGPITAAAEGPGGTGGGLGVVCRAEDGSVKSAQVLDLVEAEQYYVRGVKFEQPDRPYLDIALEYAAALDASIPWVSPVSSWWVPSKTGKVLKKGFEINAPTLFSHARGDTMITADVKRLDYTKLLIPGHFQIPPIGDAHPRISPVQKNCAIEQIAIYSDGPDEVRFVGEIWDKLDNANRAALLIHEALYRAKRGHGDTTSDQTRKAVAHLFSSMKFTWIMDGVPLDKFLTCWTDKGDFLFAVYPDGKSTEKFIIQFLVYDGEVMLSKLIGRADSLPFAKQLGIRVPGHGSQGSFVELNYDFSSYNPLPEKQSLYMDVTVDPKTGVSASLDATSNGAGKKPKPVSCFPHPTKVDLSKQTMNEGLVK